MLQYVSSDLEKKNEIEQIKTEPQRKYMYVRICFRQNYLFLSAAYREVWPIHVQSFFTFLNLLGAAYIQVH